MPDAVRRRSSISAVRRGNQKYIPYGGDDFQRGKRTGIPVVIIDHSSDDFEPFEKLMDQADQRTPPRPKVQNKKKRPPKTPIIEETDDYGEIDMELEYSTPNSPAAYFTSRVSPIASSVKRVGSSSRPVNHSSDVDFNEIPSPRPLSSRKSLSHAVNGRGPGPSRLSRSFIANNSEENEDPDDLPFDDAGYDHIPPMDEEDDGHLLPPSSPPVSPTRSKSFGRIHEEGDEENGSHRGKNSMRGYEKTPSTGRGKGKQRQMEEDVEIEDDIAMGMEDVNMEEGEEEQVTPKAKKTRFRGEDESTEREQPASKKTKTEREAKKKPGRNARKENVLREVIQDNNIDDSGLRRGARVRYAPLDWWRNEKVVYGRRGSGGTCLVPSIKEIRRIPKEDPVPLGKNARKRSRPPRSMSKTVEVEEEDLMLNPEEGWDDDTQADAPIVKFITGEEVVTRLAWTAKMLNPKPAANNDFFFQKVFSDSDFIAAGQIIIPPKKSKPTKGSRDNTFIFYVIEGAVTFKVHRSSFVLTTGGMFMVPRGNMYYIQNISDRDAKLFFAQARKVEVDDEDTARSTTGGRVSQSQSRSPSRKPSKAPNGKTGRAASRVV